MLFLSPWIHPGPLLCLLWFRVFSLSSVLDEVLPLQKVNISGLFTLGYISSHFFLKGFLHLQTPTVIFLYLAISGMFFPSLPALSPPIHSKVSAKNHVSRCCVCQSPLIYAAFRTHICVLWCHKDHSINVCLPLARLESPGGKERSLFCFLLYPQCLAEKALSKYLLNQQMKYATCLSL